ncbi:motile sperm domain-containing protein 2-like isoform X2 [Varroa jacobsoni]|uniref:CRAL-TRIO domain-containing protein n=1 Tax=Varroa destructor TaxID=109461 RepID=A0A7M7IY99_VARDE|nr:motile sperm domain-containing protein 2-like isoform X2 [Varroa destructor]XP_022701265.1 motile sperm domain-containing protein 2-like isoform X2 [Varroa jacobsoni]
MSGKIGKTKSKEKKCKVILRTSLDKQDIRRFQQLLRNTISASSELYDPKDVDVLVEDEVICEKFLRRSEACVENALDYAIQSFRWRKTFGVSAIDASGVSQLALDSGVMYFHGFSIGDAFILIFRADLILEPFDSQEETLCHRYLVMFLEEAVIRRKGNVTLLFDCTKARKENLHMGYVKFLIKLFKSYYPDCLDFVLIYELPVILHACWKIVSRLVPANGIDRIKFVDKKSLRKYIDENNLPRSMGGQSDYVYQHDKNSSALPGWLKTLH